MRGIVHPSQISVRSTNSIFGCRVLKDENDPKQHQIEEVSSSFVLHEERRCGPHHPDLSIATLLKDLLHNLFCNRCASTLGKMIRV